LGVLGRGLRINQRKSLKETKSGGKGKGGAFAEPDQNLSSMERNERKKKFENRKAMEWEVMGKGSGKRVNLSFWLQKGLLRERIARGGRVLVGEKRKKNWAKRSGGSKAQMITGKRGIPWISITKLTVRFKRERSSEASVMKKDKRGKEMSGGEDYVQRGEMGTADFPRKF